MAMSANDAIKRIREAVHDISEEYTTEEYLDFVNSAIQQVSSLLISAKYPTLVREVTIREGDRVPDNFATTAGSFPIRITGDRAVIVDPDMDAVTVRYFATPKNLTSTDDELPFNNEAINAVIIKTAVLHALNRNEYDISQDVSLTESIKEAVAASLQ